MSAIARRLSGWIGALPLLMVVALFGSVSSVRATEISGTIATTLVIYDDSELVGDVTCTVVGAPCIAFGASGITLKLKAPQRTVIASQ